MRVGENSDYQALGFSRLISRHSINAASNTTKLASGSRINNGGDDPAGITIAAQLKGRAMGYDAAAQNAQNAATVAKTADTAYSNALDILYRMRELSTQNQDASLTEEAKKNIEEEATQLTARLTDIAATAKFGTTEIFGSDWGFILSPEASGEYTMNLDAPAATEFAEDPSDIDAAIDTLAQAQGKAGAWTNALGYVADGLALDASNMWSAYTSFTETNTAKEMTNYVKNTVLTQQAQLINAQYNQNAYSVLNLLK